jgi:rfaE bifunctional protein nucleotidyltransferase chain/domain
VRSYVNKIKTLGELKVVVAKARKKGETVVLANGAFDLIHVGHIRYLKGAKSLGDILIVAVNDDRSIRMLKGKGRPIIPIKERLEILSHISCIDYCTSFSGRTVEKVIMVLKPDIHAKGTDYTRETVPERGSVLSYGGTISIVGDPKNHSTSDLIGGIAKCKKN